MDRRACLPILLASFSFGSSAWAGRPPTAAADARTANGVAVTVADPGVNPPASGVSTGGTTIGTTGGTTGSPLGGNSGSFSMFPGLFITDPVWVTSKTGDASNPDPNADPKDFKDFK